MLLYQYSLLENRNIAALGHLEWLGYSASDLQDMGGDLVARLIYSEDVAAVIEHHKKCAKLTLGGRLEVFYRMISRQGEVLFAKSIDRCQKVKNGECVLIEGECYQVTAEAYEARRLIEDGLTHNRFCLHYQPIVDMYSQRILGHEALARCALPGQDAFISPAEFLPWLIGTDLEMQWVTLQLKEAAAALENSNPSLFLSFNLSGSILQKDQIKGLLSSLKIDRRRFIIEVSESVDMASVPVRQNLKFLQQLQLRLELDDFPTGVAPVTKLMQLSRGLFWAIKLDRSVCHDSARDRLRGAFAKSLINIAIDQGLQIVCEGIERQEDWLFLRNAGASMGQGYFWSKPLPQPLESLVLK